MPRKRGLCAATAAAAAAAIVCCCLYNFQVNIWKHIDHIVVLSLSMCVRCALIAVFVCDMLWVRSMYSRMPRQWVDVRSRSNDNSTQTHTDRERRRALWNAVAATVTCHMLAFSCWLYSYALPCVPILVNRRHHRRRCRFCVSHFYSTYGIVTSDRGPMPYPICTIIQRQTHWTRMRVHLFWVIIFPQNILSIIQLPRPAPNIPKNECKREKKAAAAATLKIDNLWTRRTNTPMCAATETTTATTAEPMIMWMGNKHCRIASHRMFRHCASSIRRTYHSCERNGSATPEERKRQSCTYSHVMPPL